MENETDKAIVSMEIDRVIKELESKQNNIDTKLFLAFFNTTCGNGYEFMTLLSNDKGLQTLMQSLEFANDTILSLQKEKHELEQEVIRLRQVLVYEPKKWHQIFKK